MKGQEEEREREMKGGRGETDRQNTQTETDRVLPDRQKDSKQRSRKTFRTQPETRERGEREGR